MQIYWKLTTTKNWIFSDKNSDFFYISAQNLDCGYSLEPPRTSTHNICFWAENRKIMYTPVNQFYYIKVGFDGVKMFLWWKETFVSNW